MVEDGRAVLSTCIATLAVLRSGIVHFVEEFEEGGVGKRGGVEDDLERFGVCKVLWVSRCKRENSEKTS